MKHNKFVGSWVLAGYQYEESTAELTDDGPDALAISEWINNTPVVILENITEVTGLALEITSDGDFVEVNSNIPDIEWFNIEGVLDGQVRTFNGAITLGKTKISMLPSEIPSWAIPEEDKYEAKCRFDDGDVIICDLIQIHDDQLIRTVNTVVDEEHLFRTTLVYTSS